MRMEPLEEAANPTEFGHKAAELAHAIRAGLDVPDAVALDAVAVEALMTSPAAAGVCERIVEQLGDTPLAVRASVIEEAGTAPAAHVARLNVRGARSLLWSIREVWSSGRSEQAVAMRRAHGVEIAPRIGVIVQRFVAAERGGLLWTVDPESGADVRLVDASWGLPESVQGEIVSPDRWHLDAAGAVLEARAGEKDVEIVPDEEGVTERHVDDARVHALCLEPMHLDALGRIAAISDAYFGEPSRIEWAVAAGRMHILQRDPIRD